MRYGSKHDRAFDEGMASASRRERERERERETL